jgi:hypothetical protein
VRAALKATLARVPTDGSIIGSSDPILLKTNTSIDLTDGVRRRARARASEIRCRETSF